ncbi:MAG: PEP-CTERM sorting domain-containing protein [Phycisphaerales bacterium]
MTRYSTKALLACVASAAVVSVSGTAMAVPYAAQVSQTGNTVNYVLNEAATTVTITRDGGNQIVINGASAGAASFDMTGFSTYSIEVSNTAAAGWTESSVSLGNAMMAFERANGVAVNMNPGSASFGQFYVSHRAATSTASGRSLGDGIYAFNADGTDLGGITDPNDTSAARDGGGALTTYFTTGGSSSPFRLEVDKDDNLLISDWSDAFGGVYIANADVSTGNLLLANPGGVTATVNDPLNPSTHGSVVSTPIFKGSLSGGDFQIWTIDEDKALDKNGNPTVAPYQNIWRYDIGSDPGATGYAGPAELAVDLGTIGTNSDGSRLLFGDVQSVDIDVTYDSVHDNFVVTSRRNDGNETGLLIFDGDFSTILFNSKQFSIDNGLDGTEDDLLFPLWDGIQDIFRGSADAAIAADGSFMAIHRSVVGVGGNGINDFFGPGDVIIVPLDANGVPDLDLTDAGLAVNGDATPQDIMLGTIGIDTAGGGIRSPIAMDLAGNIYVTSNGAELAQVFSPGGNSVAVTNSDGTFTINGVTYGGGGGCIEGDLNCDGFVGIADLNLVLGNWNATVTAGDKLQGDPSGDGFVGIDDLNKVLGNWNNGTPPSASAVPEPATLALLGLGGLAMLKRRR